MARREKETLSEQEPAEQIPGFLIPIDEFLSEIGQREAESKASFKSLTIREKIVGMKPRSEWQRLYRLFKAQPVVLSWSQWLLNQGGK